MCVCVSMSSERTAMSRAGPGIRKRNEKDTIAPIPALCDRFHPAACTTDGSTKRSINRILLPGSTGFLTFAHPRLFSLSAESSCRVRDRRRSVLLVRNRTEPFVNSVAVFSKRIKRRCPISEIAAVEVNGAVVSIRGK